MEEYFIADIMEAISIVGMVVSIMGMVVSIVA
jgi:hypothetical protein